MYRLIFYIFFLNTLATESICYLQISYVTNNVNKESKIINLVYDFLILQIKHLNMLL